MSLIKRPLWTANPLLLAYLLVVSATVGLLVNRSPDSGELLPVVATPGQHAAAREREAAQPPLWLQLFRPSPPTARLLLRTGLPTLPLAGSDERRDLSILWTGRAGERPQSLFQVMLPFLRPQQQAAVQPPPPGTTPPPASRPPTGASLGGASGATPPGPATGGSATGNPGTTAPPRPPATASPGNVPVLAGGLPLVGIYHTHDWESYSSEFPEVKLTHARDLMKIASFDHSRRTIVSLGEVLAVQLRDLGVTTVHAPFRHQELGYDYAYQSSRNTARQILRKAPSVKILLDLHRDGTWGLDATTQIDGKKVAQIRCVIGTRSDQPNWQRNKAFCDDLVSRLEAMHKGLTLPTLTQGDRYNQDLLPGAILLEIGNATNSYAEAERAVGYLAAVLVAMIAAGAYPQ